MPTPSTTAAAGTIAQQLQALLHGQLARIRQRFALHGLAWMIAAAAVGLGIYYAADRWLNLPLAARLVASAGLLAYLGVGFHRRLWYPLRRPIARDDVAVAFEHRFPELQGQLISAVQLHDQLDRVPREGDAALRNQSPAMIQAVLEQARADIARMARLELLQPRRTVRVAAFAGLFATLLGIGATLNPPAFGVFLQRACGRAVSYPRSTTLVIELPESSPEFKVEREGNRVRITAAQGADLPVVVRADGTVPREVRLVIRGGRGMPSYVAMAARGQARFRHVFRRIHEPFEFFAAGGDDDHGDVEVVVSTIRPPRVANIHALLTPPAYAGIAPTVQTGGAVEALEGTKVRLQVSPTDAVQSATLTFLESGREIVLEAESISDDAGTRSAWAADFVVERSDRYQVLLTSANGLRNPHPGVYPIVAVADRAPTGRVLAPADDALAVVLTNGIVGVRLEAHDDFGLATVRGSVQVSKANEPGGVELLPVADSAAAPTKQGVLTWLLDVAQLPGPVLSVSVGDTLTIGADLTDNRQPVAHGTKLSPRQVHVVAAADLARRIAGHFRRIRDQVEELRDLQGKLLERLQETLDESKGTDADRRAALTVVQVGQARVLGRALHTNEDLMRAYDVHLHNRLDESPHANTVLELWQSWHREHPQNASFLPEFYAMLEQERALGRLGACPKTLDPILEMILACGRVALTHGPQAVKLLNQATVDPTAPATAQALTEAGRLQREIQTELQALAERLEAWNEFQDVILQTRSVLDKQREVQVRTRDSVRNPVDAKEEPDRGRKR